MPRVRAGCVHTAAYFRVTFPRNCISTLQGSETSFGLHQKRRDHLHKVPGRHERAQAIVDQVLWLGFLFFDEEVIYRGERKRGMEGAVTVCVVL